LGASPTSKSKGFKWQLIGIIRRQSCPYLCDTCRRQFGDERRFAVGVDAMWP